MHARFGGLPVDVGSHPRRENTSQITVEHVSVPASEVARHVLEALQALPGHAMEGAPDVRIDSGGRSLQLTAALQTVREPPYLCIVTVTYMQETYLSAVRIALVRIPS